MTLSTDQHHLTPHPTHPPTQGTLDLAVEHAKYDRARLERHGCRAMAGVCAITTLILGAILWSLIQ